MSLELTCPDCEDEGVMPVEYTCEGKDIHPPLVFKGPPKGTQSFALMMHDPNSPNGNWIHWLVWNIPPDMTSLEKGFTPEQATEGLNSWGANEYGGPCPPSGERHGYVFTLYALDMMLDLEEFADVSDFKRAIANHILEQAELTGFYQKQKGFE